MKVILLRDVGGTGKKGEVRDIADGYAMNFLIPRGLVAQATPESIAAHSHRLKQEEATKQQEEKTLAREVQSLAGARIEIRARATEKGGLFKTVGPKEIAQVLVEQRGVTMPPDSVEPLEPVKTIGDHIVKISAGGAESEIMLKVIAV